MLTDFQNFCTVGKPVKFANLLQNLYGTTHLTLGVLLYYVGKLKTQIFSRYSADMEENGNKSCFKCIDFNLFPRVTVYAVCCVLKNI